MPPVRRPRQSLATTIKESSQFDAFLDSYDAINRNLNVAALVEEVTSMHVKRRVSKLTADNILANSQFELIEANAQNQAYRSRLTQIHARLFVASSDLDELIDSFWKWCQAEFAGVWVEHQLKSQDARWSYVVNVIAKQQKRLRRINSAIEVCKIFLDDYDAAGYSLMRINATMQINARDR